MQRSSDSRPDFACGSLLRRSLSHLTPYVAGKGIGEVAFKYGLDPSKIVKLGSNENPYGPSPSVRDAILSARPELYPEFEELQAGLARYAGYDEEHILMGCGMDGVIDTLSRLFLEAGDHSLIFTPTFSFYEIVTTLCGAEPHFVQRDSAYDIPGGIQQHLRDCKMTFLCSPNNPTGNIISADSLRAVVEEARGVVFLDEAYAEFARVNHIDLVRRYDNLVVGRTMSKAFGLAGLRIGYAVAPAWITEQYRKAAPPFFGLSTAATAAGSTALADLHHMRWCVDMIRKERDRLHLALQESLPTEANFLCLKTNQRSGEVVQRLLHDGIIVRDCASFRGAGDGLVRVTVGTPEQNDRFLNAYLGKTSVGSGVAAQLG